MNNILFSTLFLVAFATGAAHAAHSAFVTIAPQQYFVDKISGGRIPVSVMVLPGANPHAFEPKPRQMTDLAKATVYFTIGDSFDTTWLDRILGTNPGITIVRTEAGATKIPMAGHDVDPHDDHATPQTHGASHPEEHDSGHDHGTLDPHIWLDPALVRVQAENIRAGLCAIDPEHAAQYTANAALFTQELEALDAEIRAILAPLPAEKRTFLVFHPSWGYFAKAYGLTQAAIEVEGKEPSPKELTQLIALGKESGATVVFVQPQFSEKSAAVIAKQLGAKIVRLDPLSADWANNLRQAARAIADALR